MKHATPISDLLRKTIADSGIPLLTLEQETGVNRATIRYFLSGDRILRLDMADRLAAYFKLKLTQDK